MAEAPATQETPQQTGSSTTQNVGHIVQITGPVVDVEFEEGHVPDIYTALEIDVDNSQAEDNAAAGNRVVLEVEQSLGNNWVRAVSMNPTEGLARGMNVRNTGQPISVPVGEAVLGRVFNVIGDPVDDKGPVQTNERLPIHRDPPAFQELATSPQLFETGIKVIDLIAPFSRGGK